MRGRAFSILMLALVALVLAAPVARADEADDIRACDGGNVARCEALLVRYREGPKWLAVAETACKLNSSGACNNLGSAWADGRSGATAIDYGKARAYYAKACDLGNGMGCFNSGNVYRLGEGAAIDLKLAFELFKKSCDLAQAKGCTELAIMHYEGKAAPKNIEMAKALFEKGCKLGSPVACKNADLISKR